MKKFVAAFLCLLASGAAAQEGGGPGGQPPPRPVAPLQAQNGKLSLLYGNGLNLSGSTLVLGPPTATVLGGIYSAAAPANQFQTGNNAGVSTFRQPSFSDLLGTLQAAQLPALTGDVSSSAGSAATSINPGVVTYAKQAPSAPQTFSGNATGTTGARQDISPAQAAAMLAGTPTGLAGPVSVPGTANSLMRSDAAPAVNQSAAYNWSGTHSFSNDIKLGVQTNFGSYGFFMPTFNPANGGLYLLGSNDGYTWNNIVPNAVYYDPGGYAVGLHDPSTIYLNGQYYTAYTTSLTNSFAIATSSSLASWNLLKRVDVSAIANSQHVWAPEFFYDPTDSIPLRVFFCANTVGATNAGFQLYETHPQVAGNLGGAWSAPVQITGTSLPSNMIDPFMIKVGSTYNLWYTNGSAGSSGGTIEYMSSTSVTSGYTVTKSGNWTGTGTANIDGVSLIQTGPTNWNMYFEDSNYANQEWLSGSADNWATWSAKIPINASMRVQHGTVLPVFSQQMRQNIIDLTNANTKAGMIDALSAQGGQVGEVAETPVVCSSTGLTSGTATNAVSMTLGPGDWDVSGNLGVSLANGTVISYLAGSVSTSSATLASAAYGRFDLADSYTSTNGVNNRIFSSGPVRILSSNSSTVYGVVFANFSSSTAGACGHLIARRMH